MLRFIRQTVPAVKTPCAGANLRRAAIGASYCSSFCPSPRDLAARLSASVLEPQRCSLMVEMVEAEKE